MRKIRPVGTAGVSQTIMKLSKWHDNPCGPHVRSCAAETPLESSYYDLILMLYTNVS